MTKFYNFFIFIFIFIFLFGFENNVFASNQNKDTSSVISKKTTILASSKITKSKVKASKSKVKNSVNIANTPKVEQVKIIDQTDPAIISRIENLEKQFKDNLNHYSGQNNTIFDSISRNLKSTSDNITDKGILNNPILNNSILNGGAIVSAGNLVLGSNSLLMTGELGDNENRIKKGWLTDLEVTNTINGSISGNAATVTNGLYSNGSYSNPTWLTSVPYSILSGTVPTWNQNTTGNADTATSLKNSHTIAGVSFNGTSDMSIASTNLSDTANLARLDASNSFSVINPITTLSESWIGPSSSTGIYFKGGNVGIGTVNPSQSFDVSGNAIVSGSLGVGNSSIPGSLSLINRPNIFSPVLGASQTIETVSGSHFGVSGYILLNGNTNVGGLLGMIEIPSTNSNNITSTVKGSFSAVNNYGTGTASSVNGSWSSVDNYGIGTITDARGADISVYNDDNGNITKGLGASIGIDNYGNGNITNSTGNSIYAYNEGSGTITTNKGIESFSNNYGTGTISTNYGYYDEITNASTALISSAWGVSNNILNTGRGTITTARGYGMRFQNTTGSTIGTLYGFSAGGLNDVWSNAGTINTSYGIYLGSSIDVGITKYAIYSASVSNSYYAGNIGIGTSSPANILSLGGTAPRTIWMERNTTAGTAGQGLTLSSGGAIAGTANLVGGDLTLKSGISTGTGSSSIHLFTATAGSTGTADNATTEKMTILGSGYVGIGASSPSTKLEIGSSDLGNGIAGPVLTLGRNTNATNAGAGSINFLKKDGTSGYVWQDAAGNMRINTSAPITTNDTAGTVIGAQTSTRNTKQDITDYTDYDAALSMVTNAPLHKFRYINEVNGYGSDSPLAKTRIGFIADEVDPAFMVGNVIDQVSVNGILMASIKDLDLKVKNISLNDPSLSLNLNIKNILAEISNNIIDLYAKVIHSDKVETKMLCVGSTCVTEQQFLEIVNKNTPVPTPTTETTTPVPTPTTETTTI